MSWPTPQRRASRWVPDFQCPVKTRGCQPPPVRSERHGADSMAVLKRAMKELAGSCLPNPQDSRPTDSRQKLPIGTVSHARRRDLVFLIQPADFRAVVRVPDGDRPISAVSGQVSAVRTESQGVVHALILPGRSRPAKYFQTRNRIPKPDRPVAAGRGEVPAIRRTKGHAENIISMASEPLNHLP